MVDPRTQITHAQLAYFGLRAFAFRATWLPKLYPRQWCVPLSGSTRKNRAFIVIAWAQGRDAVRILKTTVCVLALMAATGTALAQTADQMGTEFELEIARWQVQQTAAERDIQFVDQVYRAFYTAAKLSSREPQISEVNAALAPLRARYPNHRLSYKTNADYCRVSRAILDARSAALTRMNTSLENQSETLARSVIYNRIKVKMMAGELLGQSLKLSDIAAAFREDLAGGRGSEVQTDWGGGMGAFMEPTAGEQDCS